MRDEHVSIPPPEPTIEPARLVVIDKGRLWSITTPAFVGLIQRDDETQRPDHEASDMRLILLSNSPGLPPIEEQTWANYNVGDAVRRVRRWMESRCADTLKSLDGDAS